MFQPVCGPEVDLEDPATFSRLPQTIGEVLNALYREIGYAKVYMLREGNRGFGSQVERIEALVREVAAALAERKNRPLMFWQERLYVFLDEIENMC